MLRDITIGQHFPGNSALHTMDPRLKLLLTIAYIIMLFVGSNFVGLAISVLFLVLLYAVAKIPFRMIAKSIKPILPIILFTAVLNIFFMGGKGDPLVHWGFIRIYAEGLRYAAMIAVLFIFINYTYPFQPVQQTLISTLTIGTPSFILALEPNKDRLKGTFILNVIRQSIPASLTMTANIVLLCALSGPLGLSSADMSTLAVVLTCLTGFIMLFKVSTPFNGLRGALFGVLLAGFLAALLFLSDFFALTTLTLPMLMALAPMLLFAIVMMLALVHLVDHVITRSENSHPKKRKASRKAAANRHSVR